MRKIFLLHGWTYTLDAWQSFLHLMEENGYKVTPLPVPGLTTPIDKAWTLNDYVIWLDGIIAKEKEKPIVIAHSNGGRIACAYAATHGENLAYLILIDSAGIYHREFPLRVKRFVFGVLAKTGKKYIHSPKIRSLFYKLLREHDYEKITSAFVRQTMVHLITTDITPFLSRITTPARIIWGEDDTMTPLSDAKRMRELMPHATLHIIQGAKHAPYKTHTEQLAQMISETIQSI